jgi:F-type H+-transporting ATPase subunit delta
MQTVVEQIKILQALFHKQTLKEMANPLLEESHKKTLISFLFSKVFLDQKIHAFVESFILIVWQNNRLQHIRSILDYFISKANQHTNTVYVTLSSAVEITKQTYSDFLSAIEKYLNKNIHLSVEVDAQLLAGYVLCFNHKIIDASLAYKIKKMQSFLT